MKRAKILSASAGSGKTYQLALKYMCDIIEHPERYRNILAVTFTNKATEEMKSRILSEIHILASGAKSKYIDNISEALGMSEAMIRERALKARTRILHDFSRFSVLTIDRFFQRILRAFIQELSLDLNYNIELDATQLLERGADALVDSISKDKDIRRWLLEFAEERISDGTQWDMRGELSKLGAELFQEGGAKQMNMSQSKADIRKGVDAILDKSKRNAVYIKNLGKQALDIMEEYDVNPTNFKGKSRSFVTCFAKYASGELMPATNAMLQACDDLGAWYSTKDASGSVITATERLMPILRDIVAHVDEAIKSAGTAKIIQSRYRSFALLADLQKRIEDICDQESTMILSSTKDILSKFIDDSNAPFIYEKVGNRYDHYMIDEFQDTSVREWRNMLPLLKEALASNEKASVFIVGDIKQSIYRWRGGDWRLLNSVAIDDLGRENTEVIPLKANYRSLENIVTFNNKLIEKVVAKDNEHINDIITRAHSAGNISNQTHKSLHDILTRAYSDHEQQVASKDKEKGYVEVCAYNMEYGESPFIEAIESAIARGYKYSDILILVRTAEHAQKIADTLFRYKNQKFSTSGEVGFNILMPDKLTLESCDIVEFAISVLRLAVNERNDVERGVYNRFLGYPVDRAFSDEEHDLLQQIVHLSPMEAFELIVAHFKLYERKQGIAFLQALHEQIISFSTSRVADIQHYLTWWDERGKKESVKVEMTDDTIEITTIHKAKGLERDIVIIPHARIWLEPLPSLSPIVWSKTNGSTLGSFPVMYGKSMATSTYAEDYYKERVMSHVDGINILYVAITRASRELYMYIPTRYGERKYGESVPSTTPLILDALPQICSTPERRMDGEVVVCDTYHYGVPTTTRGNKESDTDTEYLLLNDYVTNRPTVKVVYPSSRFAEEGIKHVGSSLNMGILLHGVFEKAKDESELHKAIDSMMRNCRIDSEEATTLQQNVRDALRQPKVNEWFNGEWDDVRLETEIAYRDMKLRRPDRVMIKGDRAVVVDYKFGEVRSAEYKRQVRRYMSLLEAMGRYKHIEGYVWYIMLGEVEEA
ncbi:MAG: UvrD-helicase domain-containing protein [Alistipes sp.]|nr:UvrD-helicase domain-containing protein [Alistipes sp.]